MTNTRDPETPWSATRIMMEGKEIVKGPVTYEATQEHDSGSASVTVVTKCQQNKHVYVEADQASNFPYNSCAPQLTSFVGYRISNEEDVPVAFMAVLAANFTPPADDVPIIMDKVITDTGGRYDDLTGSFVCPDNKLYMFSLTVVLIRGSNVGIFIENEIIR